MWGKRTHVVREKHRGGFEQQSDFALKSMWGHSHEQPLMDNKEWEERLFQINGKQMKLKYKPLAGNNAGTSEFEFESDSLEIEKWIQVEPSRLQGEVFSYENGIQKDINYVSQGGMAEFIIPGIDIQKAQMLTLSIVMHEQGESEVFFMLNEPIELKIGEDYALELESGKYAKMAVDTKGTMYFQDAKMYYKNKLVNESVQVESDEAGLRFDGKSTLLFEDLLSESEYREKDSTDNNDQDNDKRLDAEMFFDDKGAHLQIWKKIFLNIHGEEIRLEYRPLVTEYSETSEYRFGKEEWELQKGIKLHPGKSGGIITEKAEPVKEIFFLSWGGGKVTYKIPNLKQDKERDVPLNYLSMQTGEEGRVKINFAMRENPIIIQPDEELDSLILKLQNGSYVEDDDKVKFYGAEVLYKEKLMKRIEELVSDDSGLHLYDNSDVIFDKKVTNKKFLDTHIIDKEDYDNLDNEDLEVQVGLEFLEDGIGIIILENTIYKTLDGFAEIRDLQEEIDDDGNTVEDGEIEGNLYLSDIPIFLSFKNGKDTIEEWIEAPDEAIEGVQVTVDKNNEKKFNAKKEEPISVTYDLVEVELEKGSGTTTFARKVTLDGIEVKDGTLTVKKVTIENALEREQESEDEAKELFNCTVSGSVLHSSDSVEFNQDGLVAIEGKTTLGTLSIEDFLGFLSGSINYPEGRIHVSAGKEKEAETPTILEFGDQNLGEGLSIPIPGTMEILKAKFSLTPSAKIGGSVELDANRGKSLDSKWGKNETLELEGKIAINGEAGLGLGAGLEAGFSYLANIDLMLTASLLAQLDASIGMQTKMMCVVEKIGEKEKKHLKQADDFNVAGEVGATLTGTVSLGSNVKFLFWKKNLFDLELYSKELGNVKVSMEAKKEKGSRGITSGWEMLNKKGFAQGLSKSVEFGFKNKEAKTQMLEEKRKKILEDAKGEADDAWAALMELEKGDKDRSIILDEKDKKSLEKQIKALKDNAGKKIKDYLKVLKKELERLGKISDNLKKQLEEKQKRLDRLNLLQNNDFSKKAELGGFSGKEYDENTSQEMLAVDFMIARTLGEVSKENLAKIRGGKENQRIVELEKKEWEEMYHKDTFFGNDTSVEAYSQYTSYYRMLKSETITKNRPLEEVPEPYRSIVEKWNKQAKKEKKSRITNEELFRIALTGKYEEETIEATAEQKERLMEFCFRLPTKLKDNMGMLGLGEEEARGAWMEKMNDELQMKTGDKRITLKSAAKNISTTDFDSLTKSINEQIASINDERAALQKRQDEVTKQIAEIPGIIENYNEKLETMNTNAIGALINKNFDAGKAKTALNIYSDAYLGKIKDVSETLEKKEKELEQARATLNTTANQEVILDNIILPPLISV